MGYSPRGRKDLDTTERLTLNCESMGTHLQETWKIKNKVLYYITLYIIIIFHIIYITCVCVYI